MTDKQVERIASALWAISQGGISGPAGLESVAMALSGEGLRAPVGVALQDCGVLIESGLNNVAESIRELAEAIRESRAGTPHA